MRDFLERRNPVLASKLDPGGTNVVVTSSVIDNGRGVRALLLLKLRDCVAPAEAMMVVPIADWQGLAEHLWAGAPGARPN